MTGSNTITLLFFKWRQKSNDLTSDYVKEERKTLAATLSHYETVRAEVGGGERHVVREYDGLWAKIKFALC